MSDRRNTFFTEAPPATDFRVRFRDRAGELSGDWTNFPTEARARAFASQAILNDPTIFSIELAIEPKGGTDER